MAVPLPHLLTTGVAMKRTAVLLLVALIACRPDAEEPGPPDTAPPRGGVVEFNGAYWHGQAEADSQIWRRAFARCQEPDSRNDPQCAVVLYTALIRGLEEAAQRAFPEYPTTAEPPEDADAPPPAKPTANREGQRQR